MPRPRRWFSLLSLSALAIVIALAALGPATAATPRVPRWVRHVLHNSGGISSGVRERLAVARGETSATKLATKTARLAAFAALQNVQLNGDTDPPLPQDEPGIALNLDDP
jgi:hypothetical protein